MSSFVLKHREIPALSNTHTDRFPLCRARFVSDLAPVLTLLNARLCIQSPQGEREISLRTFYSEDGVEKNPLFQGEILVSIKVPIPRTSQVAYRKLRIRNTIDFPSLGVALSILDDTDKKLFMVEAAITGIDVLPRTFHVFLSEYPSEESMLENLCSQARKGTTALRQDFFSPAYRKKMIGVFICSLYYKLRTGFGEAQSNQTKGKGNVDHE
jgi:CO/xanthine dehydrogenase FAD-binding subunit